MRPGGRRGPIRFECADAELVLRCVRSTVSGPEEGCGCSRWTVSALVLHFHSSLTISRGEGGATMTQPVGGFAHAAISTMFNPPPTTPRTPSPSTTYNPTITPATQHHRESNAADISGAVVGAVAGLAMVVGLSVWLLRRELRKEHYNCSVHQQLARGSGTAAIPQISECKELPTEPPPSKMPADRPQGKMTRNTSCVEWALLATVSREH